MAGLLLAVALLGCGGDKPVEADTGPFERAIVTYLRDKNMGMRVDGFESLEVEGDAARARCVLKQQSGLHRLGVKWSFTFERQSDGTWKVTSREVL